MRYSRLPLIARSCLSKYAVHQCISNAFFGGRSVVAELAQASISRKTLSALAA